MHAYQIVIIEAEEKQFFAASGREYRTLSFKQKNQIKSIKNISGGRGRDQMSEVGGQKSGRSRPDIGCHIAKERTKLWDDHS